MKAPTLVIALAGLLLTACSQDIESEEAVRRGVMSHLAGVAGLELSTIDVEITSVVFREDEAEATVSFRPSGSTDPAAGMQMVYTLEREGGGWVVRDRAESGASPHGAMPRTGLPPGHPSLGEAQPQGEAQLQGEAP